MPKMLFEEVAAAMRRDLLLGDPLPGSAVASEAELMRRYRVPRAAVQRALFLLRNERMLETREETEFYTEDPKLLMQAREKLIRDQARRLFEEARAIGLEDHRTIHLVLDEGGYAGAKG